MIKRPLAFCLDFRIPSAFGTVVAALILIDTGKSNASVDAVVVSAFRNDTVFTVSANAQ